MTLLETVSKAAAAADAGELTSLSNFPVAFNSDAIFPNLISNGGDSFVQRVSGWKISETDSEFADLSAQISKNLSRKLKNPNSLNRDEFLSSLNSFLAKASKSLRLSIGFEPSDSGFTAAAICKLGFLIRREIAGLVAEGCVLLGLWEVLETLVIQGLIVGNLTSTNLIAKLIEKNKPELLCLCVKHISDLRSSDLLSILKCFLSPSKDFYTNMVAVKKQWESQALEAVEKATTKKGPAKKALRVAKEASVLLMMAHDGFSLRESCLHYVFGSMNLDGLVLSSAISRLSGSEVLGLVRYFMKWLEKYQKFPQAVPCPSAGSVLGLRACESVPTFEAVVSGLGLVLDEHFSYLVLNSQFHDEMRAVEKVVNSLASEAQESCPINNIIKHLQSNMGQNGGVKLRHDASFHTLHELFFPSKLAKDPGIDSESPTLQVNPHSEADVDGEADKPDMASDATKQKEEDLLGDNKRIVVPVAADLTQQEALFVLKKLKIIDYDVNANELCTRREYARWLVKTNTLLERNPKFRICPSASIAGSAVLAFDDVSVIDPDFWCIQALGESGLVPSKFLAVSSSSTNSNGQGSLVFSPESSISRFDLLNWKALLEYSFNSEMEDKVLRKNIGLLDLNSIFTCASRQLLSDLMADDKSITRRVFGNIRRLQPHKPVTKAQAAVTLTSGRMAEAIRMELSKIDAEELAKSADMEEIRSELIHKGDIQRLWEEKLIKERNRGFEVERDFHVALHDLETEKMVRDEKFAFYMKEKVALDCQRQLLSNLREEVDGMCDRLTTERVNIVSEQHSLEKTSVKVLARQEGLIEAKSILEAEKEALEILRCWVEDEARGIQERAKLLEQAIHRWKWNEGSTPATS